MTRDIKDLQKLIEQRAADKLAKDLFAIADRISKEVLLQPHRVNGSVDGKFPELAYTMSTTKPKVYTEESNARLFGAQAQQYTGYNIWGVYLKQLQEYWLPIYIERESKEFLEKLDKVKEDVDYLLDNAQLTE